MPTMLSVLEEENTGNVYSSHIDSNGITVIPASPTAKPLKTLNDVQNLLQQGRKQDVKQILRNNAWPVNDPIRRNLWQLLCAQHHSAKSNTTDGFYGDMVTQVFGSEDLPDKPISLPPFVEPMHCQSYYLTRKGRLVADRVVSVLGYACPDIVYSPSIYPICALLLHYMSGKYATSTTDSTHTFNCSRSLCFCYLIRLVPLTTHNIKERLTSTDTRFEVLFRCLGWIHIYLNYLLLLFF